MPTILHRSPLVAEYQMLLATTNWPKQEDLIIDNALANSLYAVVAVDNNQTIGMARIVGDGAMYFYIQDVVVHSDHKNKGIGKMLMMEIMNWLKAHVSTNAFVGLMAADGAQSFYYQFGFKERPNNAAGMHWVQH